jgi:hypothetical protein
LCIADVSEPCKVHSDCFADVSEPSVRYICSGIPDEQ